MKMKLYAFWASSCAWRVRLALAFKGLPYEYHAVPLANGRLDEEYFNVNPLGMVPALETDDGILVDSVAILEYLEEKYPEKRPLLPKDINLRAQIRAVVNLISAGVQPLQNGPRVLGYIEGKLGAEERLKWAQHWIDVGFTALEKILKKSSGKHCFGDEITLADIFVIPQIANAERYKVDMSPYPTLVRINEEFFKFKEVQESVPRLQPDAPVQ